MSEKRIHMFIDSNNFYKSAAKTLGIKNPKFSWADLLYGIRDLYQTQVNPNGRFVKAFYGTAISDREDNPVAHDKQQKFIDAISKIKCVQVLVGHLLKVPTDQGVPIDISKPETFKHVEKQTDMNLGMEIFRGHSNNSYDVAFLVAADGDYANVVKEAKEAGKEFYLVLPTEATSNYMQSVVGGKMIWLTKEFLLKYVKNAPES